MASMADISVLNKAGGSVVYVASAPSAGDSVPAVWRANALATQIGFRPEFRCMTRDNAKRDARVVKILFKFPVTAVNTDTSLPFLVATVPFELNVTLPTNVDAAIPDDAFIQFGNLISSSLIRTVGATGYAPT